MSQYPPSKVIAVDVDGTLIIFGVLNRNLVQWCRYQKEKGFKLMLWSARGEDHARNTATKHGIEDLFHVICGKPGYIVDDLGWSWIKYTRHIKNFLTPAHSLSL